MMKHVVFYTSGPQPPASGPVPVHLAAAFGVIEDADKKVAFEYTVDLW